LDRTAPPPTREEFLRLIEELLKDELGTLPGGIPAVWVDMGDVPAKPTGLTCLIDFFENIRTYEPTANYGACVNFDWVLRLIQRDRSPPGRAKLDRAITKLRQAFPIHQERPLPPADGSYPQISFFANFTRSEHFHSST
jgi:hypothetical protein